jgi:hypothetical protein
MEKQVGLLKKCHIKNEARLKRESHRELKVLKIIQF